MSRNNLQALNPNSAMADGAEYKSQVARWNELIRTGLLPANVKNGQQAIVLASYGAMVGWSPIESLQRLYEVHGRVCISGEGMLSIIQERAGDRHFEIVERSDSRAAIKAARRSGDVPFLFEFTAKDAQRAGLWGRGTWKAYPADMLWWKCVARVYRSLFSDLGPAGVPIAEDVRAGGYVSEDSPGRVSAASAIEALRACAGDTESACEVVDAEVEEC